MCPLDDIKKIQSECFTYIKLETKSQGEIFVEKIDQGKILIISLQIFILFHRKKDVTTIIQNVEKDRCEEKTDLNEVGPTGKKG